MVAVMCLASVCVCCCTPRKHLSSFLPLAFEFDSVLVKIGAQKYNAKQLVLLSLCEGVTTYLVVPISVVGDLLKSIVQSVSVLQCAPVVGHCVCSSGCRKSVGA